VTELGGDFSVEQTPEKADVLITETVGAMAFAEDPNPDVSACIANNLKEDGRVLPGRVRLWLAGMPDAPPALYAPFRRREYGLDLTPLMQDAMGRGHIMKVSPDAIVEPRIVADVPFPGPPEIEAIFTLSAPCEAVCGWFDLELVAGVVLPTDPAAPPTMWKQSVLPVRLDAGEHTLHLRQAPEDRRTLLIEIDGQEVRLR